MIKLEYILDKAIKKIKKGEAIIINDNIKDKETKDKKTILVRNINGDDYVIVVKKNNKSNLKT